MDQWTGIAGQFGIPVAMLLGIGYFWLKHGWPFIKKLVEDSQAQRKAEIEKFVDTVRSRDVMMAEMQRENLKVLTTLTSEMTGMKEAIRGKREI